LRCFDKQVTRLARQHYVVAVDLPYHGHSGVLPLTLLPDSTLWVESIRAVLTHLDLMDRPLTCVAWSFGGLVIRNYLLTYEQQHLQGLILVGSLFGGAATYQSNALQPGVAQTIEIMIDPQRPVSQRLEAFERWIGWLTAHPLPPDEAEVQYGYNLRAFVRSLSVAQHWIDERPCDNAVFLRQIQIPVLLIQGLEDRFVPIASTRHLAFSLPQAQLLEYEQCGHAPFLEQPERFTHDVLRFLSALGARSSSDHFSE
jgi:non-heme chloroperoxidase